MNQILSQLKSLPKPIKLATGIAASITSFIGICFFCLIVSAIMLPSTTPTPTITSEAAKIVSTETVSPTRTNEPTSTTAPTITVAPTPTEFVMVAAPTTTANLSLNCIPAGVPQIGKVIESVDGDTIKVLLDGAIFPVRYIGMDTPEMSFQHDVYGKEAGAKNSELVLGKMVYLYRDVSETDRYNRLLRYVVADGIFVNYELVITGFAQAKDYPPDTACSSTFHEAESMSQQNKLGLWSGIIPIPIAQPAEISTATISAPVTSTGSIAIKAVNKQAEYVIITNTGQTSVNLSGWILVSEKGNQSCALGGFINPGADVFIWSQGGNGTGFACNYSSPIWNNSAVDPAVLYNPSGNEVSRLK